VEYSKGVVVRKGFTATAEHGLSPSYVMLRSHVRVDSVSLELTRATPKAVRARSRTPIVDVCIFYLVSFHKLHKSTGYPEGQDRVGKGKG
jgi:hypothetical protein